MTILKTPKQREKEARNKLAIATFQEVKATCVGSLRQMCIETARRMKQKGYTIHDVTIFKLVRNL